MKVVIIYATYSGSTQSAATTIADILQQHGHTVSVKDASTAVVSDIQDNDLVIIGTPSWDFDGKEGQPHEDIFKFMAQVESQNLAGKPVAIFGMGDTSYAHFCGAVDILEDFAAKHGLQKKIESLKVDRYFTSPGGPEKVTAWAQNLASALSS